MRKLGMVAGMLCIFILALHFYFALNNRAPKKTLLFKTLPTEVPIEALPGLALSWLHMMKD